MRGAILLCEEAARVTERCADSRYYVLPDRVTAWTDRWTYARDDILRSRPEGLLHRPNRFCRDLSDGAAPTRVDDANSAVSWIV